MDQIVYVILAAVSVCDDNIRRLQGVFWFVLVNAVRRSSEVILANQ
jgi:hypothetical protein